MNTGWHTFMDVFLGLIVDRQSCVSLLHACFAKHQRAMPGYPDARMLKTLEC